MTDKLSSDELDGLRVSEAIRQGVLAERDELRAALNEALAQNERFNTRYRDSEAENERLNGVHHADQYTLTLQARENEGLRAAIEAYLENDSQANWDALAALVGDQGRAQT